MGHTVEGLDPHRSVPRLGSSMIWLAGLVALLFPTVIGASDAAAAGRAAAVPDVTVLFNRALQVVHNTKRPTYSGAIVLEADGITKGGRCTPQGCSGGKAVMSASGVVSWRFVFDNQPSSTRFKSATLTYGPSPKAFGPVKGYASPFLEDRRITKAPRMRLSQAVSLMRRAGYHEAFSNVTLRSPLGPKRLNPLYIFGLRGHGFIAVDTVTKRVRPFS